jgi:hypothetical protein
MTFGEVISRGVSAAHRSITGLILFFLLYGLFQASAVVAGGLMQPEAFAVPQGPGPPQLPPEFPMIMAYGCFSCIWLLVMVFAGPWVTAGTLGQLHDRIQHPGSAPQSFAGYAGRFYVPLLILTLILVVIVVVAFMILGLLSAAITFDEMGGFPMQPAQARQLQTHPVNVASNVLGTLLMVSLALVFNLANSIVVIEHMDALTALGKAFEFVRRQIGDAGKLWVVNVLLALVMSGIGWSVQILEIHNLPMLLVLGMVIAVYLPYVLVLNLSWSVSLWLARTATSTEDTSGAEPPMGDSDRPVSDSSI